MTHAQHLAAMGTAAANVRRAAAEVQVIADRITTARLAALAYNGRHHNPLGDTDRPTASRRRGRHRSTRGSLTLSAARRTVATPRPDRTDPA